MTAGSAVGRGLRVTSSAAEDDASPPAWDDLIATYLEHQEQRGLRREAVGNARTRVVAFARFALPAAPSAAMYPEVVDRWLAQTGWSASTRSVARGQVRDFLRWAVAVGALTAADAAPGVQGIRALHGVEDPIWASLIGRYLEALLTRGVKASGVSTTRGRLASLGRAMTGKEPGAVASADLEAWVGGTGWSPKTQRHALTTARALLRWAEDEHIIGSSVALVEQRAAAARPFDDRWTPALAAFEERMHSTHRRYASVEGYVKHVGWLADTVDVGPWDLTRRELGAWFDQQNWSAETRRKVMVSIRAFYGWATSEGLCEFAPTAGLIASSPRRRGPAPQPLPTPWVGPVDDFLASCRARNCADGTLAQRRFHLGRLAEVLADPWAATTEQLSLFLADPDWSPAYRRSCRSSLRVFYAWASKTGRITTSPAEDLDRVIVPRSLPRPAPDSEILAALTKADDRVRLMILLGASGGLRRAEIAGLHTSQISDRQILVTGKAGHQRVIPLEPGGALAEALAAELARRRDGRCGTGFEGSPFVSPNGYLFPSDLHPGPLTPAHVGKLISATLPDGWAAHSLRHRMATVANEQTGDLRAVQEILGHAKPETTAIYTAVSTGAKEAIAAAARIDWTTNGPS